MIEFNIRQLFPAFLLADTNGYAMARAIEAGLKYFLERVDEGMAALNDYSRMPEWRLDELAWEYNIPYDYAAEIEVKREWIRNVYSLSRLHGTPEGLRQYMQGYFRDADVTEFWEYGGDPYHFKMTFPDSWTPKRIAWATQAIQKVKNVRSVLDSYAFEQEWEIPLHVALGVEAARETVFVVRAEDYSDMGYYADENGDILLDEFGAPLIMED